MIKKVERNNGHIKEYAFPATAACRICKYQLTETCETCLTENLPDFEPRDIPFEFLRTFNMQEYNDLPNVVKGKILAFYVIKIMEMLNGRDTDCDGSFQIFKNK